MITYYNKFIYKGGPSMNVHEFFKEYRNFSLNFDRLHRWYLGTLLSYDHSIDLLTQSLPTTPYREKIYFKEELYQKEHLIQHDKRDLLKKFQKGYQQFLDEMVLIRLVTLLEVFLVDMVKTIFFYDKSLFYEKGKYELNISEFLLKDKFSLETDYINKLTSKLGRSGFEEIEKLYLKKFNINFSYENLYNYNYTGLKQLHDTRHLIIHKLGKTDDKYRNDYNYSKKKISLSTEKVFYYLELIASFTKYIKKELETKILKIT